MQVGVLRHACPLTSICTPPSTTTHPPTLICPCAEEAHATQFGPYATTTAAAQAEQRGDVGRFFSAAHMLEEAWAW